MYGEDILCEIWKVSFEIPHKISYPHIERYDFYTTLKFKELLGLRALTRFWNNPWSFMQKECSWGLIIMNVDNLTGQSIGMIYDNTSMSITIILHVQAGCHQNQTRITSIGSNENLICITRKQNIKTRIIEDIYAVAS